MHPLTLFALALSWPAAVAALALNVFHVVVNRPRVTAILARFTAILLLWLGLYVLLKSDPSDVYSWWVID